MNIFLFIIIGVLVAIGLVAIMTIQFALVCLVGGIFGLLIYIAVIVTGISRRD
ncbi:MAG: hypothetical protein ABF649_05830 [Bacillus sp. (in: firmicutes)]